MGSEEAEEAKKMVENGKKTLQLLFGFVGSMALKCAVELKIADIINSHGSPITLSVIAAGIDASNSPNVDYLLRVMRFLVSREMFTAHQSSDGGDTLYGLNHNSKLLLNDSDLNLGPLLIFMSHPSVLDPWHQLSQCVKEGGNPLKRTHGSYESLEELVPQVPGLNRIFNEAMDCTAKVETRLLLLGYQDGFKDIETLVDVGGGMGGNLAEIVKANSHLKGINFDFPHVVATAPTYERITHVGGDMFESVPKADAIIMKRVLHAYGDELCVKILQNCRKALPGKTGKLIILEDTILASDENNDIGLILDLVVLIQTATGKERTGPEWTKLLATGGFPRYKIIKIPNSLIVIEAYTE